ncbi:hypothetical protein AVEN_235219-1 [Araneus ventricosus]|uniref:RNase H type-1 domain-containing protein n=1 Tax=Araneus ventricosus TaxID=182803 RepID=A0A4Y2KA44_ARAVE|nr:hypothetical protein AVEN_235219-1 [Araneus ventricosus]
MAANDAAKFAAGQDNSEIIVIHIDNQAYIISSANPRTPNAIAININNILLQHPNIKLTWIKAHAGYEGNEYADMLAKQAAENSENNQTIDIPKCHVKSFLKEKMMHAWQTDWNAGRIVYEILPTVKQRFTPGSEKIISSSQAMAPLANSEKDSGSSKHQTAPVECTAPPFIMPQNAI